MKLAGIFRFRAFRVGFQEMGGFHLLLMGLFMGFVEGYS